MGPSEALATRTYVWNGTCGKHLADKPHRRVIKYLPDDRFKEIAILALIVVPLFLLIPFPTSGQGTAARAKAYPLSTWSNITCRAKGRFQNRDYCASAVMDEIVADGKSAIPVLISQITDSRWIAEPVYDYWPRIRAGELARSILSDLFFDDTWQKSTMPPLFP
jgi:hypothetical protein